MPHPTRTSWLSKLFGRGPRKPIRNTPRPRLGFEPLEDRVVPVTQVDAGGLRFLASTDFDYDAGTGKYSVFDPGVTVAVGFVPQTGQTYTPLVRVNIGQADDIYKTPGRMTLTPAAGTFTTTGVTSMDVVVVGGSPAAPVRIWNQTEIVESQTFTIGALTGYGQSLDANNSEPFTVKGIDFQLSGLLLSNDDPTAPQVKMQGSGTLQDVPLATFLSDLTVDVAGIDYVVADKTGITVTGFDAHVTLGAAKGYTLAGMQVTGEVDVGYSQQTDRINVGGGIQLTSATQDGGKVGLNGLGGTLDLDLQLGDGVPQVEGFTVAVTGSFTAFGLTVSTTTGQPFGVSYNTAKDQVEISGGLQFDLKGNTVAVSLGTSANPGLIVQNGLVQSLSATVTENFSFAGATLSTDPSNGLNFSYDRGKGQFEMFGGLTLTLPNDGKPIVYTGDLGTDTDPGVIVTGGTLQQLNVDVSGSFALGGLSLTVLDAGFKWNKQDDSTEVFGTFQFDFGSFQAQVSLGTDGSTQPGLTVADGTVVLDALKIELENAALGPITLKDLVVNYTTTPTGYDVAVDVDVVLPGDYEVKGDFEIVDGKLDSLGVALETQVAIGDTGLFLTELAAEVQNIDNPSEIVVTGKVGVIFGEQVTLPNPAGGTVQANLFHAEGIVTIDADEFILECDVQLGAYSTDGGSTYQGVLGQADGKLDLNWHTQVYSLHVEADGVMGIFDITGDLVFAAGKDIRLLAEADVVVPSWVPFIGGDTLGGFGFYFEHVWPQPGVATSTTFAAWIDVDVIWPVTVGFEVMIDGTGGVSTSLIGGDQVSGFKQAFSAPTDRTFTFSTDLSGVVPASATSVTASVDWSRAAPGVTLDGQPKLRVQRTLNGTTTTYTEDQFAANGIAVVNDGRLTNGTSTTIQIVGSATDQYAPVTGDYVLLVDIDAIGGNPFPSFPNPNPTPGQDHLNVQVTSHTPAPVFGPTGATTPYTLSVPGTPTGTFPVTVGGNVDEAFLNQATVSLYRVSGADPFGRAVLVDTVKVSPASPPAGGQNWAATVAVPIDALSATPYTLFAVLNDGHGAPVVTPASNPFTPTFAVRGTVTNQNGTAQEGLPVFLDYNRNGTQDQREPGGLTGPDGYAFTAAFDPLKNWDPVPVNAPFDVVLTVYGPDNFAPTTPKATVTFDGRTTVIAAYNLNAKSGVTGVVFNDTLGDGNAATGVAAAGAVAYIDTNGNAKRDAGEPTAVADAGGNYAFRNLSAGDYPVRVDPSSVGGGTPWVSSPSSEAAYTVAVGASGYDLEEGRDFGLLAPSVFTGTVTGSPLANGRQQPAAPQAGWPVALLAERVVLAVDAGGTGGYGFTGDEYVTGGTEADTGSPIDTTGLAAPPNQAVLRSGRGSDGGSFTYTLPGLNPGADYTVRLYFAETGFRFPGQRKFNAAINGTQVLFDFDIVAAAGAANTAVARDFPAEADANGNIVIAFTDGSRDNAFVNAIQVIAPIDAAPDVAKVALDSGGNGGAGGFAADGLVTGGSEVNFGSPIDTSRVLNPAPAAVYQSVRSAGPDGITYTLPGFDPGRPYTVRLHFAEIGVTGPGQRKFNVDVNRHRVLTDFDIFAAAGGFNTAYAAYFDAVADAQGRIVVAFTNGSKANAIVSGVEVFEPTNVVGTAVTDARGNYTLVGYGTGRYSVVQAPPAGWRQADPFYSAPTFSPTPASVAGANPQWPVYNADAADFNGDGLMDVVAGGFDSTASPIFGYVAFYLNNGDGSFTAYTPPGVGLTYPYYEFVTPLVGDFDGDHRPDVAVVKGTWSNAPSEVDVFLNTGDPTNPFQLMPGYWSLPAVSFWNAELYTAAAAGDLNGDGLDDVLVARTGTTPDGAAAPAQVVVALNATDPAARTVSRDTVPVQNAQVGAPNIVTSIAVTDMNGDGLADAVMIGDNKLDQGITGGFGVGLVPVAFGDGKGGWASWRSSLTLGTGEDSFNGVAVGPGAAPRVFVGGTYASTQGATVPGQFNVVPYVVGLSNSGDGTLARDGSTLVSLGRTVPTPQTFLLSDLRLRDLNGDTRPDLVYLYFPSAGSQAVAYQINTGTAEPFDWTVPPDQLPLPSFLTAYAGDYAVADFDNDGLNDVFVPAANRDAAGSTTAMLFRNTTPQNQPGYSRYVTAGATVTRLDFASVQTPAKSAVHGQVFEDVRRNGVRDTGDVPTAGARVFADLNRNGRLDPREPRATTSASGHYALRGLADGTYSVGVLPHADWSATAPGGAFTEVTVAGRAAVQADFGRGRRLLGGLTPQAVRVGGSLDVTVPAAAAAAGRRLVYSLEGAVPAGLAIDPAAGRLTWSPTAADAGRHTVTVRVRDPFDTLATDTRAVTLKVTGSSVPMPLAAVGGGGRVRVLAPDGTPRFTLAPFGAGFRGSVRVATGDVTGDGVDDVIAAAGSGAPRVVVFDGETGAEVERLFAFGRSFRGGAFVAAGDVNGDGHADVVAGAGPGGSPRVRVLSGADRSVLADFPAFDRSFRGGVRVAAGDVNGDGHADVIAGAGPGGGSRVKAVDGRSMAVLASFPAYGWGPTGGVFVAAGDVTGDGRADIVTGGGGAQVRVFDPAGATGSPGSPVAEFLADPAGGPGRVRVAVKPAGDGRPGTLLVGSGDRGRVTAYRLPITPTEPPARLFDLDVFAASSGVFVG